MNTNREASAVEMRPARASRYTTQVWRRTSRTVARSMARSLTGGDGVTSSPVRATTCAPFGLGGLADTSGRRVGRSAAVMLRRGIRRQCRRRGRSAGFSRGYRGGIAHFRCAIVDRCGSGTGSHIGIGAAFCYTPPGKLCCSAGTVGVGDGDADGRHPGEVLVPLVAPIAPRRAAIRAGADARGNGGVGPFAPVEGVAIDHVACAAASAAAQQRRRGVGSALGHLARLSCC